MTQTSQPQPQPQPKIAQTFDRFDSGDIRPVPDPTRMTSEALAREISNVREIIFTRLAGMDKAVDLLREDSTKIPTVITGEIFNLKALYEQKFESIETLSATKFENVKNQFTQRDIAVEAALAAQKESAGATDATGKIAIDKMEANFTKLIDEVKNSLALVVKNADEKINDLKGRFDRGEGRTSVSDPAVSAGMTQLTNMVSDLTKSRDQTTGGKELWAIIIAVAAVLFAFFALIKEYNPYQYESTIQQRLQNIQPAPHP